MRTSIGFPDLCLCSPYPRGAITTTIVDVRFVPKADDDNGSLKDKRPNIRPAAWRHQSRDPLNEAQVPFDFFFVPFFFMTVLLRV